MLSFTNNYIPNRWGLTCLRDKLNWQMFSSIMVSASRCENTSPWWHGLCPLKLLNTSAPPQARTYGTWLQHQGLVECETSNVRKSLKSLNVWEVKNMRAAGEEEKALIISECWQCTDVSSRNTPPPHLPTSVAPPAAPPATKGSEGAQVVQFKSRPTVWETEACVVLPVQSKSSQTDVITMVCKNCYRFLPPGLGFT